jgi:hypothetical protein
MVQLILPIWLDLIRGNFLIDMKKFPKFYKNSMQ